jgi:hypothetical protein
VKRVLASTPKEAARKFVGVMTGRRVKDVSTDDAHEYLIENDFSFPVTAEAIPES